ncbi:VOC family protein [Mariniluteicoccus flavus]
MTSSQQSTPSSPSSRSTTGTLFWADATVSDVPRAQEFYSAVAGWTFPPADPAFGGYASGQTDGDNVAGLQPLETAPVKEIGWDAYLQVDDVHAYADKVRELGGSVESVVEMPPIGDFVTGSTPSGARLRLFRPEVTDSTGGGAPGFTPGHLAWGELVTSDIPGDAAFLAALFGGEAGGMGDGSPYQVVTVGGEQRFGVCTGGTQDGLWRVYYLVPDTDAAVREVEQRGGRRLEGPFDSPFGRCAFLAGPEGETFALIQPMEQG